MKKSKFYGVILLVTILALSLGLCLLFAACNDEGTDPEPGGNTPVVVNPPSDGDGGDGGESGGNEDGGEENEPPVQLPVLTAPSFSREDVSTLKYIWTAVENCSGYLITVSTVEGGVNTVKHSKLLAASATEYTIPETAFDSVSTYSISLVAKGVEGVSRDSAPISRAMATRLGQFPCVPPIEVSTPQQLQEVSLNPTYHYALTADLDMSGIEFQPIGMYNDVDTAFSGSFDGRGHTVSNLSISRAFIHGNEGFYMNGLFGQLKNASVKNLNLVNYVSQSPSFWYPYRLYVGILAGSTANSTIQNVTVKNSRIVWTTYNNINSPIVYYGGLIGCAFSYNIITDCSVEADVTCAIDFNPARTTDDVADVNNNAGTLVAGGLIGSVNSVNATDTKTTVERCSYSGKILTSAYSYAVGGLIGEVCPHTTSISADYASSTLIRDCYTSGEITAENKQFVGTGANTYNRKVGLLLGACVYYEMYNAYTTMSYSLLYDGDTQSDTDYMAEKGVICSVGVVCWTYLSINDNLTAFSRVMSGIYYLQGTAFTNDYDTTLIDHTKVVALTPTQFASATSFSADWDFENVWQFEENATAPTLRT